ncbi:hypothetical protein CFU_0350 [Collimonas fungivorans Ter331]|uniref:Uncharacterized protein n=1 Tax=Collimonas fungivorans (strain Ter331) TaxID=1005048 RepID=G0AEQ3_COLFT|nr:hypothetical protein CFU_0350 [Collimonas fungivorans Ter331]
MHGLAADDAKRQYEFFHFFSPDDFSNYFAKM